MVGELRNQAMKHQYDLPIIQHTGSYLVGHSIANPVDPSDRRLFLIREGTSQFFRCFLS